MYMYMYIGLCAMPRDCKSLAVYMYMYMHISKITMYTHTHSNSQRSLPEVCRLPCKYIQSHYYGFAYHRELSRLGLWHPNIQSLTCRHKKEHHNQLKKALSSQKQMKACMVWSHTKMPADYRFTYASSIFGWKILFVKPGGRMVGL